jgi:ribose transport system substrate-binding protein
MSKKKIIALAVTGVALSALAACGQSSDATSGAPVDEAALVGARKLVDQYTAEATTVGVTEPLSRKPDTGKRIVWLECNVPTCQAFGNGIEDAADVLGWDVTTLRMEFTPESMQSAFEQAVSMRPDAILSSGGTPSVTLKQRQMAKDAGIPFFDNSAVYEEDPSKATGVVSGDPAPPKVLLEPAGFVAFQNGRLPAAWAVTESQGRVHSIFVNVPDIPIIVRPQVAYKEALEEWCPDTCTNVDVNASVNDIGTNLPQMVVSALQQHPDTNYIVYTVGDFSLGVAAAVKAAGFTDVKTIGATPIQANIEGLASGTDEAWVGVSNVIIGWRLVDAAARTFNGDPIPNPVAMSPDDTSAAAWPTPRIYTADNSPSSSEFVEPANYQDLFRHLWQLS